jgi:hypothetical protein
MVFPELESDESVIVQAHNIKVKSVMFEAVLTNKRLILIDGKKGLIPPQTIAIPSIRTVDCGENAIRDPIITFSIFSTGGQARQMILTFPREASGERRRERDDWLRALNMQIEAVSELHNVPETPTSAPIPPQTPVSVPPSPKKKIEITRPRMNVIETVPAMPRPVETTTLPVGSFCSRCGNRVSPESMFCNKCGTAVSGSTVSKTVLSEIISPSPQPAPPAVPQVQVPLPPVFGMGGDRKPRPLEEVIHSIEPLIEDSKPRTTGAAPLVPRHYPAPTTIVETPVIPPVITPATPPVIASEVPQAIPPETSLEALLAKISAGETVTDATTAKSPAEPVSGVPETPEVQSPAPVPEAPLESAALPPKKPNRMMIAALAIVILVVIGGILIFSNSLGGISPAPAITPVITPAETTATPTTVQTPVPTKIPVVIVTTSAPPKVIIPKNGVWLRITYPGKYSGTFGTPGNQMSVGEKNTGDQFYMVSTINGPVEASIQKMDGSSDMLIIEVYKDGEQMKRETTISPKGIIDFQVDFKPAPTPEPTKVVTPEITPETTPAETAATNTSVNATETV